MRWALLLFVGLLVPAAAQGVGTTGASSAASAASASGLEATVLLFHPLDQVDPFGIPFEGGDPFAVRYQAVAAQTGQFDYPVFVADGTKPIQALPEPGRPFQGTVEAYEAAFASRQGTGTAAITLTLQATVSGDHGVLLASTTLPTALQENQGQELHLRVALAEDPVHYQPPAPVSNGVVDHRFTVRAYRDLGAIDLAKATNRTVSIPLDPSWQRDHLLAAAWVQADGTPGRFAATEVLQATHARLDGVPVRQESKGVLLELYSATWCTPCLYGDLALEQVAIQHAGARELAKPAARYFEAPPAPLLAVSAALLVGAAVAFLPRRGRP